MPCCETEAEREYYANLPAKQYLESNNIKVNTSEFPNQKLCELCAEMPLAELRKKDLEQWYLKHLFTDGQREPYRALKEILRLYKKTGA